MQRRRDLAASPQRIAELYFANRVVEFAFGGCLILARVVCRLHRTARQLPRLSQTSRKSFRVRLGGEENVFTSRFSGSPVCLALHFCRIAVEESNAVTVVMEVGIIQASAHRLLIPILRVLVAVQSAVGLYDGPLGNAAIRV